MAEESAQEKTEEPTARKLQKAREDGQVARSQELPGAAVMIGAVTTMVLIGSRCFICCSCSVRKKS